MTIQNAILVFVVSAVLLVLELALYFSTGMPHSLTASGLGMVAAYKFLWMTVLTGAAGLLAPVAALIGNATGRKELGVVSWGVLVLLAMAGYTTISYVNARSLPPTPAGFDSFLAALAESQAPTFENVAPPKVGIPPVPPVTPQPPAVEAQATPPPPQAARKIADTVEFVDSKTEQVDPEKIRVLLHFKNKTTRRITEIDYAFTFLDEAQHVLLSIDLREGLFIPPGLTGESTLDWGKAGFKEPGQFDRLKETLSKGTLKVAVTIQRAALDDGSVAEG